MKMINASNPKPTEIANLNSFFYIMGKYIIDKGRYYIIEHFECGKGSLVILPLCFV